MSDVVIKAEHLSKMYRLGVINNGTLWKDLQTWTALKFGKEDPHSRIGEDKYAGSEDHFWALKDLNFEIHQGDRVGIIGKNGAGKSTLLKILSRVTAPTEGSIKIKGKIASLLEVGTGFNGELTGRENIYLNGAILGMKKRQIDRKLEEIIDFSEIEHHIDTPVKRYSSGMYVRLAFAVAAHLDSDILIADEVLAVGDAAFQKKALGKMESLSTGEGRTVLFVSHNIAAVKALCNKGIVLEKGRIVHSGNIDSACNYYKFGQNKIENDMVLEWKNTNNFFNANFTPISFKINNTEVSVFDSTEPLFIELNFNVTDINPLLHFCISIHDIDGNFIFSTGPLDEIENYTCQKGVNKMMITLPPNIFNTKNYILKLEASIHNTRWICNPSDNSPALYFEMKKSNFSPWINSSTLLPVCKWDIV